MNKDTIIFIFNIVIHVPAFLIAISYLFSHYIVKSKKDLSKTEINPKIQNEYIEDTHKLSHITLNLLVAVVIVMIFDTFVLLHSLQGTSDETLETSKAILAQVKPKKDVFTYGTDGIYEEVKKEFEERKDFSNSMDIDIIGYTMYSVAPKLKDWFQDRYLKNMNINLIYLDPDFIGSSSFIDKNWRARVIDFVSEIKKFISDNSKQLKTDKVLIKFTSYKHIPGIHGFRFRKGRCFISFSTWDLSGKIKLPTDAPYFIIEKNEKLDHGNTLRKIMDNWIDTKLNDKSTNR